MRKQKLHVMVYVRNHERLSRPEEQRCRSSDAVSAARQPRAPPADATWAFGFPLHSVFAGSRELRRTYELDKAVIYFQVFCGEKQGTNACWTGCPCCGWWRPWGSDQQLPASAQPRHEAHRAQTGPQDAGEMLLHRTGEAPLPLQRVPLPGTGRL